MARSGRPGPPFVRRASAAAVGDGA